MNLFNALVIFLSILYTSFATADGSTTESAVSREALVYESKDWSAIYMTYKKLGGDFDGVVAGAFVDKISWMLEKRWGQMPQLKKIIDQDPVFYRFVLSNLNEAVPIDRANNIKSKADKACPKGAEAICKDISNQLK